MTVTAIRRIDRAQALEQLRADPVLAKASVALLAKRWGVARSTARNWMRHAHSRPALPAPAIAVPLPLETQPSVLAIDPPAVDPPAVAVAPQSNARANAFAHVAAYATAAVLAAMAAYFSVGGMAEIFPGAVFGVIALAAAMEAAKLVAAGWLARNWRTIGVLLRTVLIGLVTGLAVVNAAGVYGRLVEAHVGVTVAASSSIDERITTMEARIAAQTRAVTGIDRQLEEIDAAIAKLTERGRAAAALSAIASERKARDRLIADRAREAAALTDLRSNLAKFGAERQRVEAANGPIVYLAAMAGIPVEQAIRWLILLMVLTCDPTAIALTVAASRHSA